jgi:hypothetical protein
MIQPDSDLSNKIDRAAFANAWLVDFLEEHGGSATRDETMAAWTATGRGQNWLWGAISRFKAQDPHESEVLHIETWDEIVANPIPWPYTVPVE